MQFDEFHGAVTQARRTLSTADRFVGEMAGMIKGKLRSGNVSNFTLDVLKRELRDYNIHTGRWKDS